MRSRWKVFAEAYIRTWSATQAAIAANYSIKTAYSCGPRLLKNAEVQAYIQERLEEQQCGADEVLKLLSDQSRASMTPFLEIKADGSTFINLSSDEARKHLDVIKKIKTRRVTRKDGRGKDADMLDEEWVEIELLDVTEARSLLGRHHKLFTDQIKIEEPLSVEGLRNMLHKVYENDNSNPGG